MKNLCNKPQVNALKLAAILQNDIYIHRAQVPDLSEVPARIRSPVFSISPTSCGQATPMYSRTFWIPEYKIQGASKLPKEATVYTAELSAILEALHAITLQWGNNYIIFTDCQSAVNRLSSFWNTNKCDHLIYNIVDRILWLERKGSTS